jgi:hypothetical protein
MGIPSWARVGAKCVSIDRSFGDLDPWSGCAVGPADIFTLLETKIEDGVGFCRTRHDQTGYEHELTEWARLSRFRPLSTAESDISEHFADLLNVPHQVDA